MHTLSLSPGGAVRLCVAFLCGALFGLATFVPDSIFLPLLGTVGGAAIWILTLAAARRVMMPGLLQALAMAGGAATFWLIALVLALSSMD